MQRKMARLLVLGALVAALTTGHGWAQQVQVSPANRTIAITTTENAERRADVATLHIGYHVFAPDSAQVYAQAATVSQAIAAALAKLGVAKDAISSESQSTGRAFHRMGSGRTRGTSCCISCAEFRSRSRSDRIGSLFTEDVDPRQR